MNDVKLTNKQVGQNNIGGMGMDKRRTERINAARQILADEYDYAGQHERASVIRTNSVERLPAWAHKKLSSLLQELQRDAEECRQRQQS